MTIVAKFKKKFYFIVAKYFRFFANRPLKRWNPRIIAITGSAGKTTMLHLMEHEIGPKAHYSHHANSIFGICFDILGLKGVHGSRLRWLFLIIAAPIQSLFFHHKEPFYVVEIDSDRPYEAEMLAAWLKPEVTIWVSVGLSHAAKFETLIKEGKYSSLDQAIANEFAAVPRNTQKRVYIDADANLMSETTKGIKAEIISINKSDMKRYMVYPDMTNFYSGGVNFHFNHPEPKDLSYHLLVLQDLMKYLKLDFNPDFSSLIMPPGRSSYLEGIKGCEIIDSSYNAHTISMESILDMFRRMHTEHKWLVIGDIIEQGSIEKEEHEKLAHLIAEVKPENIILIGRRTKEYTAPELKKLGFSAHTTLDPQKALTYLKRNIRGNETILFKGSQYLEWIIEKLLKNPEDAQKLCRRDKASRKRRQAKGLN